MQTKFDTLTTYPGSFVAVLGAQTQTVPQPQDATAPPKEQAPLGARNIEVFGLQTNGRRRQYNGDSLDQCLDAALKDLETFEAANAEETTAPKEDPPTSGGPTGGSSESSSSGGRGGKGKGKKS